MNKITIRRRFPDIKILQSHYMKKLTLTLASCLLLLASACGESKKGADTATQADTQKTVALKNVYDNKYFTINYPAGYAAEGDFSYPVLGVDELKTMNPESIMDLPMNEVNIAPQIFNTEWNLPEIYIVLSRHRIEIPMRAFMDLSIMTKAESEEDELPLIGYSDVDSISFAGYPALDVEFAYKAESGDTLIHRQILVQKPDYSLYYINGKYNSARPESVELADRMLSTFRFKD